MSKLTLEQVRDDLIGVAGQYETKGFQETAQWYQARADAIDDAFKTQGEPVAVRYHSQLLDGTWAWSGWLDLAQACVQAVHVAVKTSGVQIEYAYAAPPADDRPTWEEVRAMLVRVSEGLSRDYRDVLVDRIIAEFRKEKGK